MKSYILFFLVLFHFCYVTAQSTQSISGRVIEFGTLSPLPYAKVEVLNSDHKTVTDSLGYFTISDVPIGRINLKVTSFGYKTAFLTNLELLVGKQLMLTIELTEELTALDEVTIVSSDKQYSFNEMSKVSRRTFSIEESKRYAGSLNDVQRMASSFAGITTANDKVNDIIVRGNTPSGMLFRLDGMNIPNPNHWSMPGSAGGTVSMLNNNVLRNSDFLTGAFSAEYDAFSGVFDLKSRNGNHNKHEFLAQVGFNGLEAGAEGPISKKSRSSYLFNYRKSLLELIALMVDFGTGTAVPKYQDAFLKLNFPTKKAGTFTFLANGGTSNIHFVPVKDKVEGYTYEDLRSGSNTGVVGVSHFITPKSKVSYSTTLMMSGVFSKSVIDNVRLETGTSNVVSEPFVHNTFLDAKIELAHAIHIKQDAKNYFKLGTYIDYFHGDYAQDLYSSHHPMLPKSWSRMIDFKGNYLQTNVYFSYLHKFNDAIELVSGLAYKYQTLTNAQVLEPKLSASFKTGEKGAISVGSGLYSKAPSLLHVNVVEKEFDSFGNELSSNKFNTQLKYMKSLHFVVGYDYFITKNLHIKSEVFYQRLLDVISAKYKDDSTTYNNLYTSLNDFSFAFDAVPTRLGNNGMGENYGIELTIEQFLNKGFYYLITSSLFNSRYQAIDKVWRNTRFNSNFIVNGLVGKEFVVKPKFKILLDFKVSYMKGNRFIPLLEAESAQAQKAVYDYGNAYTNKLPDFFRMDVRLGFKFQGKKISQEMAFELQNLSNRRNVYMQQYDPNSNSIKTLYQNGILPMGLYRLYF